MEALVEGIREGSWRINDSNLIGEMKTFVKNRAGKPQAMGKGTAGGCKDDRVLGYGIAQQMKLEAPAKQEAYDVTFYWFRKHTEVIFI